MLKRRFGRGAIATVLMICALGIAAGCGDDDDDSAAAEGDSVTVTLDAQNDSGQTGTATLTPEGESMTKVVLELSNPPEVPQPVHVHEGTCANLTPEPIYPLENLEDGSSETTIDVPLADLQAGEFAINAHASVEDAATYVACGDVPQA